jgi:hypothetical protein
MEKLLPVINAAICLAYTGAACLANYYLLTRLSRADDRGGGRSRLAAKGSTLSANSMQGDPLVPSSSSGAPDSSNDVSDISLASRQSGGQINQTPVKPPTAAGWTANRSPAPKSPGHRSNQQSSSFRSYRAQEDGESAPMNAKAHHSHQHHQIHRGSYNTTSHAAGSEYLLHHERSEEESFCQLFGSSDVPAGFGEIQSWFLMHVILSCLVQAITILVMGVLEENLASTSSVADRLHQDLFTIPSAVVFFSLFSMLLHILHYLKDVRVCALRETSVYWKRGAGSFAWIVGVYVTMATLESRSEEWHCIEWGSSVNAAIFALAFLMSGPYLSASVAQYGDSTALVAQKLRNVCFLVSFSMIVRFALFLPAVQSALGASIGKFASSILEVWMLVPYVSSMQLLHQKPAPPGAGSSSTVE